MRRKIASAGRDALDLELAAGVPRLMRLRPDNFRALSRTNVAHGGYHSDLGRQNELTYPDQNSGAGYRRTRRRPTPSSKEQLDLGGPDK